jgi:hypothetical protein
MKFYYNVESAKLKKFQEQLQHADLIFPISQNDYQFLHEAYPNSSYIPAFHPNEQLNSIEGLGSYVLYHGNLSVNENIQAAMYILKKIAPSVSHQVILAGKDPAKMIIDEVKKHKNVSLVMNPTDEIMYDLIKNAQINLLFTFQNTGIKLKLLNALHRGRYCLVNSMMVDQTGLNKLCIEENETSEQINIIKKIMNVPFTSEMINERKTLLNSSFSNHQNALKMASIIWNQK